MANNDSVEAANSLVETEDTNDMHILPNAEGCSSISTRARSSSTMQANDSFTILTGSLSAASASVTCRSTPSSRTLGSPSTRTCISTDPPCTIWACPIDAARDEKVTMQCAICLQPMNPAALLPCSVCHQVGCIFCHLKNLSARQYPNLERAQQQKAGCFFCRSVYTRVQLQQLEMIHAAHKYGLWFPLWFSRFRLERVHVWDGDDDDDDGQIGFHELGDRADYFVRQADEAMHIARQLIDNAQWFNDNARRLVVRMSMIDHPSFSFDRTPAEHDASYRTARSELSEYTLKSELSLHTLRSASLQSLSL